MFNSGEYCGVLPKIGGIMRRQSTKIYLALTVILALGLISIAFGARWVSVNSGIEGEYQVTTLSSDNSSTILQIDIPGFSVDDVTIGGKIYQELSFHHFSTTQEIGSPALPRVSELIAIPGDCNVRISLVSKETVTLDGYNVSPFLKPTLDSEDAAEPVFNQNVYSANEWYSGETLNLGNIGVMRGLRVVPVSVVPFRFNPVTSQLEVAVRIVVKVDYYGTSNQAVTTNQTLEVSPRMAQLYRSLIVNFDAANIRTNYGTDQFQVKYLIICPDQEAANAIQPLADFRNSQGLGVEIRVMQTGFNTAIEFRDYIHQLYASDGLEYVLMVGDYCTLTGHTVMPMYYWSNTWSDSWYTMIDPWPNNGSDYLADVAIGRFVYDNTSELQHQVDKTMGYLLNPSTADNWAEHSLLVAHREQYPQKYTECKEQIRTYPYSINVPIFQQGYGGAGYSNADVVTYLNTYSSGILNYRGHGSQTAWSSWSPSGSFTAADIAQLTNANKLFVHFDVCCDNMDFPDYNGNCFAESFMKHTYGCVALNGAIIPSYTIPNHDYDKEFYKAIYNEGIFNIGYASNFANITVYNSHGTLGESNIRTYLWLGDAAIDPWTKTPEEMTVSHLPTLAIGATDIQVSSNVRGNAVEGAMVCAEKSGETYSVGYTNQAGIVTLTFDQPLTAGELNLMVTAHNCLSYQTTILVGGSYNLGVTMTPQNPPITIPATGGSFGYIASVVNNDSIPANFDAWIDAVLPNGHVFGPIILRRGLNLNPGASFSRTLTQNVPANAPAGNYSYRGHAGIYPGTIWGEDNFSFTKSALDNNGEIVHNWNLSGWDEGEVTNATPSGYFLAQNHPNPFNPETAFSFRLPKDSKVSFTVYNNLGQEIISLYEGFMPAGQHSLVWNAADMSSGVYFYRLQAGEFSQMKKCVLMK
jgi:hypothetical protein